MEKKIQISDDKTTAIVTISVSFRGNKSKKEGFTTTDVITELENMGYSIDAIVQSASVSNCSPRKCEGTWIFLLKTCLTPDIDKTVIWNKETFESSDSNTNNIPQPPFQGEVPPLIEEPFNMPKVVKAKMAKKVRDLD